MPEQLVELGRVELELGELALKLMDSAEPMQLVELVPPTSYPLRVWQLVWAKRELSLNTDLIKG